MFAEWMNERMNGRQEIYTRQTEVLLSASALLLLNDMKTKGA